MKGRVIAVNKAEERGISKRNVGQGDLQEGWGLVGDAHAGDWDRQISILPLEAMALIPPSIRSTISDEDYTENITIEGIPLDKLGIGMKLKIGEAEVSICHIGKEKPKEEGRPYIVSREGRFGKVTKSGRVNVGDLVITLGSE
ncbi:MAG: MOSC domain-containing protein [Deltaproteobacteria bacterium]|nr:MAG: MOSC domain-containing protein [Deltaproteobacteria bacterium]